MDEKENPYMSPQTKDYEHSWWETTAEGIRITFLILFISVTIIVSETVGCLIALRIFFHR